MRTDSPNAPQFFGNPAEFLQFIKASQTRMGYQMYVSDIDGWKERHEKSVSDFRELLSGIPGRQEPGKDDDEDLQIVVDDLYRALPTELGNYLSNLTAVGLSDNFSKEATYYPSKEGFSAVVINSGLLIAISVFATAAVALKFPSEVTFCKLCRLDELDKSKLASILEHLCTTYRSTGIMVGDIFQLSGSGLRRMRVISLLWQIFVVSHEMGHVLLDKFPALDIWDIDRPNSLLKTISKNDPHMAEHKADTLGYILCREWYYYVSSMPYGSDDRFLLDTTADLFSLFDDIGFRESASHPGPRERLKFVTATFFGDRIRFNNSNWHSWLTQLAYLLQSPLVLSSNPIEMIVEAVKGNKRNAEA